MEYAFNQFALSKVTTTDAVTTRTTTTAIFVLFHRACFPANVSAFWPKIIGMTSSAKTRVLGEVIDNSLTVTVTGNTRYSRIVVARVVAGRMVKINRRPSIRGMTNITLLGSDKMRR